MTNKTRVALYARSAVETSGSDNVDAQLAGLKACCEDRGWIVAGQYHDVGKSEGKALRALVEAAHTMPRPFDVVMIRDISRVSRQTDEVLAFKRSLDALGIDLAVVESAPAPEALADVSAMLAQAVHRRPG